MSHIRSEATRASLLIRKSLIRLIFANNFQDVTDPYTAFRGILHGLDANGHGDTITIAKELQNLAATPCEMAMALFTSSSCGNKNNSIGTYSVLFTEVAPKTVNHGKKAEMAWCSEVLSDFLIAEALAVLQALRIAIDRVHTLSTTSAIVKVHIFTGCMDVLNLIESKRGGFSVIPRKRLLRMLRALLFEHSHLLANIPGVEVDLHIHCLPMGSGIERQKAAKSVAIQCRELDDKQTIFKLDGEAMPATQMPVGVHLRLDPDLLDNSNKKLRIQYVGKNNRDIDAEEAMEKEHSLEQSIFFVREERRRYAGNQAKDESLEDMEEMYIEDLRLRAPENALVKAYDARYAKVYNLTQEITTLSAMIKMHEDMRKKKVEELRRLAPNIPFRFEDYASSS